jgi:protein-histidine N-methyltransferase
VQVTLPNLLLAWYFSPASLSYRQTSGSAFESADLVASSGDIAVSGALRAAFVASLAQQHIELRFDSGDWSALRLEQRYDVVLSSETIYAPRSLATLCETLQRACRATPAPQEARLCERLRHTSLATGEAFDSPSASAPHALPAASPTTCLVAAKILYFGVGGGVRAFEAELRRRRGWSEVLRETQAGVGRVVLGVGWA